jgi:hypothetical protein
MHGGTHPHLDGFQIQAPGLAPLRENHDQQPIYFLGDLLMNFSSRFFSWAVHPGGSSSTGRSRQIFSLTATNWALRF